MAGKPRIQFEGRLGKDPEIRITPNGVTICTFSVANTPRFKDSKTDEWVDGETTWLDCVMFRNAGEAAAEALRKGMVVLVTGTLALRKWEDKEGNTRTALEVMVETVGQVPMAKGRNKSGNGNDDFQW